MRSFLSKEKKNEKVGRTVFIYLKGVHRPTEEKRGKRGTNEVGMKVNPVKGGESVRRDENC